ncbi:TPA: hypothetical protein N0F65_000331 [Lagenidium giganteum]|uniref:Membrane-associated protein n=1 Tax=Lagenidium giganteum TaxID=4803 RepID=A0AAV2YK29_9STRA|nr:TPA: hypothetical protein N0F65_000331 [Lagenidium giganteum]
MIATVLYVVFATILVASTYSLSKIANTPVFLGRVEQAFTHDKWNIPITTLLQVHKQLNATNTAADKLTGDATLSLSDLVYAKCGSDNATCAAQITPNLDKVVYLLGAALAAVPNEREFPDLQDTPSTMVQYINNLSGWNYPVMQFYVPGRPMAITCAVRRASHKISTEPSGDIDCLAYCSPRAYDPDWVCENNVDNDVTTHVIAIQRGKTTYLGHTVRGNLYYNPGTEPKLSGSTVGNVILSPIRSNAEYNDAIVSTTAPWDFVPAYLCKNSLDVNTKLGWLYQGEASLTMTWKSSVLMTSNAALMWVYVMFQAVMQYLYLPRSSVCVIPVYMAKTLVGPLLLAVTCYGNYHAQVLATFLGTNNITAFNATWYRYCGALMMSSVIGIMSGPVMQWSFNPLLVAPPSVLTIVAVVNALVVFVLEGVVFPRQSSALPTTCTLPTSTACIYYPSVRLNTILSPMVAACGVMVGCLVILSYRRVQHLDVPRSNSILTLFEARSIRALTTSTVGGCIKEENGVMCVDSGVLLNRKLVRISNLYVTRVDMVKFVLLYRLCPIPVMRRRISHSCGLVLVSEARGSQVTNVYHYVSLARMHVHEVDQVTSYCS